MSAVPRRTFVVGALGSLVAPALLQAAPPGRKLSFRITDLGTLPNGDYSSALAINNQGQIVGLSSTGDTIVSGLLRDTRAVLWQNGTVIDLVEKQFIAPQASRINNRGQILITWQYIGADRQGGVPPPEPYAVLWDRKVQHVWRARDNFLPNNLNDQGLLVGNDMRGNETTMVWRDGKLNPVLLPKNAVSSQACAINNAGTVAGVCRILGDLNSDNLFVTDRTGINMVVSNAQRGDFVCGAINQRGQVVGTFRETVSRVAHLFLWQDGKLADLAVLGRNGEINGVNSAGHAVGRTDVGACAYIDGALYDLNALLPHDSGWQLWQAAGINDHGQIVGSGVLHGQSRAFLLTPEGQAI
jgi:probable HAF family extracellular repeat protein